MKSFFKTVAGKICIACACLLILAGIVCGSHYFWYTLQPKFQDVTIELGEELPSVSAFLTEHGRPEDAQLLTPVSEIDLTVADSQKLIFSYAGKQDVATLIITDTTAPTAKFHDITADITTELKPEDFVSEIFDLSEVTVSFAQPPVLPDSYEGAAVDVIVADQNGNQITGTCAISYIWMQSAYTLELGDTLEKADLLLNPDKDAAKLDQAALDWINASPVGTYTITGTDGSSTTECTVTVQDTVAPTLEVKEVSVDRNEKITVEDFIVSVSDASGEVTTKLLDTVSTKASGTFTVTVEATDINGNITIAQATLSVYTDTKAPVFSGLTSMAVEKHSTPDFMTGVTAYDAQDGNVTFTYDASKVDTSTAGTYYVTYTAKDKRGNIATARRRIVVNHDAEDTAALIDSIAAGLSNDVEEIRDYVRNTLGYNSNWGGDDPIWYGLQNQTGNCYVHAMILDALLKEKGYDTQLIWCESKSHYWNIVYIDGVWKHVDATPGPQHSRYSLMSDKQRYETLSGRDWDRDAWPSCP